jgi:linker histone H1 and H5 family
MPTYYEMVREAILALKERNGSSNIAIKKYIEVRGSLQFVCPVFAICQLVHQAFVCSAVHLVCVCATMLCTVLLPSFLLISPLNPIHPQANNKGLNFGQHLMRSALNKGAESGKLIKIKNSYKLSDSEKKSAPKAKVRSSQPLPQSPSAAVSSVMRFYHTI